MNSFTILLLALIVLVIIPRITRQRRLAAIRHVLNRRNHHKEKNAMKKLAKQFIGKECILYTVMSMDSGIMDRYTERMPQ